MCYLFTTIIIPTNLCILASLRRGLGGGLPSSRLMKGRSGSVASSSLGVGGVAGDDLGMSGANDESSLDGSSEDTTMS